MGSLIVIILILVAGTGTGIAQTPYNPVPPKEIGPFDGSYSRCILDKMPGVASDIAAAQIAQQCLREYPDGLRTIENGRRWFGFEDGGACVAKKARDTASRAAAAMITGACYHRYGPNKQRYVPFPNPN